MNAGLVILIVGLIFGFIIIGVPVYAGLGTAGIIGLILLQGKLTAVAGSAMIAVPQSIFAGIGYFPLLAIPFYVLAGEIMNRGQITDRLIRFSIMLIGRVPGALAHANILASLFFGGITGSAQADTSAVGGVMIPAMVKQGYSKEFSVAVTAASSTMGPIIPPSIMMVMYGVTVGCSIGALFMAGFIPGLLVAIAEILIVILLNRKYKFPVTTEKISRAEKIAISKHAIYPLGMPIIIVGGIVSGIVTPTEAGVVSVVYSLIISKFVLKTIQWKDLTEMLLHTATLSAGIMMIISGARIASYALTGLQLSNMMAELFLQISSSPYVFLLLVNILLLIMGMFMDGGASVLLLAPILTPIALSLGINVIHFGLVMVLNLVIGLGTPPLGQCVYIASGIAGISVSRGFRGMLPFLVAEVAVLMLVTYLPDLILFIPRVLGYV